MRRSAVGRDVAISAPAEARQQYSSAPEVVMMTFVRLRAGGVDEVLEGVSGRVSGCRKVSIGAAG